MSSSTHHHRHRVVILSVVCVALAGGAAAAMIARRPQPKTADAAASIFKTATVTRGDLTTTESVDGSVQLPSTLTVLHRIEGQTSSGTTSTPTTSEATQPAAPSTNAASLSSPLIVAPSAPLADCSSTTAPTPPTAPTATPAPPAPAESTTTISTPDTTPAIATTTTTAVAPSEPPTTVVTPVTEPCPTTTTTTPVATPANSGGARVGGAPTGAARSAPSGTSAATSPARITQTVTSIVAVKTEIHSGNVLYTIDGAPVVALDGVLPAWRTLSTSSADGADIAQLEASLVALGYDPAQKVAIDDHFDSATRTMVKAWQQGLGIETTGTVPLGSVVFVPTSATVSEVAQAVGDTVGNGDKMLVLATPVQEVLIDVPAGDEAQVVPGLQVRIGNVQGTVSQLRSADRDGSVIVEAVITPEAPIDSATNGSAVKVTLTLQDDTGVLTAPAEALVSRLDGTYAVQLQTSDGSTKWLAVELLGVSGGKVALRGDGLTEGTVVLLPA